MEDKKSVEMWGVFYDDDTLYMVTWDKNKAESKKTLSTDYVLPVKVTWKNKGVD